MSSDFRKVEKGHPTGFQRKYDSMKNKKDES
jgi:hypothetical protein